MIKFTKYSIAKIVPIVFIFVVFPLWFFIVEKNSFLKDEKIPIDEFNIQLTKFVKELVGRWEKGDIEGKLAKNEFSCANITAKSIEQMPSSFFQCHSAYMKCFLSGGINGVKLPPIFKKIGAKWLSDQSKYDDKGQLILRFYLSSISKNLTVKLENYCHETYLPQKIYSTGLSQDLEYAWDNYGQNLFLDKFYVNQYEIRKWRTNNIADTILDSDHLPALQLSLEQMKDFCKSHGRKLLQNRLFDAATFFPSLFNDGFLFKSKYPNGNTKGNRKKLDSVSWNGVEHALGGEMEVFENLFHERGNLKVSSHYLEKESVWNQNAVRAYWEGDSFEASQFDFKEIYSGERSDVVNQNGVAFRCMLIK